jgi:hypothetical protein
MKDNMESTVVMDREEEKIVQTKRSRGLLNFDLTETQLGQSILKSRLFQPALIMINLAVFVFLIFAGLYGSPIGNRNAAIVMIWIFWFFLLIFAIIPLGGRLWCLMCPLPAPGEWLSRLAIVRKSRRLFPNLGLRWPKKLDNLWIQNIGFLAVATFSPVILTRPWATSWLLLFLIVLALAFSILFTKQGKRGLYSLMGALEVKSKDTDVCRACRSKACIKGSEKGWGCPWYEYPGNMERNAYCGLCTECIKTCPNENVAFRTRPFAVDLLKKSKLDEAFKSFIMLGSALFFLTVFFGWWGSWKDIADPLTGVLLTGSFQWKDLLRYSLMLWTVCLGVIPLATLGFSWLSKAAAGTATAGTDVAGTPAAATPAFMMPGVPLKKLLVDYAYALVPLGLMAWVGFVFGMILANGSYVVSVISDPLGWGWNLLATSGYKWRPYLADWVAYIQLIALFVGLAKSLSTGFTISLRNFRSEKAARRAMIPMSGFFVLLTVVFIYLFVML